MVHCYGPVNCFFVLVTIGIPQFLDRNGSSFALEFSDSATGEEWLCFLFFFSVWHIELELYKVPRIFVHVDYEKLKEDYSASLTNLFFIMYNKIRYWTFESGITNPLQLLI